MRRLRGATVPSPESTPTMKRLLPLLLLALAAVAATIAFMIYGTTAAPVVADDYPYCSGGPGWAEIGLSIAFWAILVGAVVLAFLPFRRSQRELPVFFRAHIFVPSLFVLWVLAGSAFPFSPHQLTQVLPGFLLGANDWGVGNIYTYTKLADWLALLAGCAACAHVGDPATPAAEGFAKRLRLCFPHLLAAVVLHLVPGVFGRDALAVDITRLFVWLFAGFAAIAILQSLAGEMRRRWPLVLSWMTAFGWLFVSVARFRP